MTLDPVDCSFFTLIFHGGFVNLFPLSQDDATPLFKACHKGRADVARLLLSYGAKHSLLEVSVNDIFNGIIAC